MIARLWAATPGLHTQQPDLRIANERKEDARGVAAAADAGDDQIGQAADLGQRLLAGFVADDRLEIAHDSRKWMRPDHGANDVVRRLDTGHPVAEGLVHRV